MLALLAVLLTPTLRILPQPFLSTELQPLVPVPGMVGVPRETVARGGSWRPGGLVRINYYYKFPLGKGPNPQAFLTTPGFTTEPTPFGVNPSVRAVRIVNGIRQMVWVSDVQAGSKWPWAKIIGPATVVVVAEIPLDNPRPPKWHQLPELEKPPLPPGFPPKYRFMAGLELGSVMSEPIIPRNPRNSFVVQVRLNSPDSVEVLAEKLRNELSFLSWKQYAEGKGARYLRLNSNFGLMSIEALEVQNAGQITAKTRSELVLAYTFADSENAPRLLD